jgi:hypothetical protein
MNHDVMKKDRRQRNDNIMTKERKGSTAKNGKREKKGVLLLGWTVDLEDEGNEKN